MKRTFYLILLIFIFLSVSTQLYSQENTNPYKLSVSGFVRADAIFDSRQVVEAREGFLLFYPKKPLIDPNGADINAKPTFNQYAMTTRITAKATGPDVLGAKVLALIEGDFTGASNIENNSLRLRHAYISLQWAKTRLLLGQYWHPLDLPEMIPNVLSLNTGAPFHSFSRQPQVRVDYKTGKLNFVAVAASQRDYVNAGPSGSNSIYIRNSLIPNLHGQIHFKSTKLFVGVAVDYKMLTPRIATDSLFAAEEQLNCLSWSGFINFTSGKLSVKTQYTYGQALNDHLMMGGFGVSYTDELTRNRDYAALNYHAAWMNTTLSLGKWSPSLFLGYTKNSGAAENISGAIYARDADIDYVYRIAPMMTFVTGRFSIIGEVEYTVAAYGTNDEKYKVIESAETGNLRIGIGVVYSF
ncbi:MAG: hypothetical protein HGA37_13465 [Lentimicrobium sp.]|nr:hypothetical protein [Lentimicrobium sp.]